MAVLGSDFSESSYSNSFFAGRSDDLAEESGHNTLPINNEPERRRLSRFSGASQCLPRYYSQPEATQSLETNKKSAEVPLSLQDSPHPDHNGHSHDGRPSTYIGLETTGKRQDYAPGGWGPCLKYIPRRLDGKVVFMVPRRKPFQSTTDEPKPNSSISTTQGHDETQDRPHKGVAGHELRNQTLGLANDTQSLAQLSLSKGNTPQWKKKAAQKKKKKKLVAIEKEKEDKPHQPMDKDQYIRFCSGADLRSSKGNGKSNVDLQDTSAVRDKSVRENKSATGKCKGGNISLPKMTARIETQIPDPNSEKSQDNAEFNSSNIEDGASISCSSSATLRAEETIDRGEDLPKSRWEELVTAAVAEFEIANESRATEAKKREQVDVQPSTLPLTEDNLSQMNDTQAAGPVNIPQSSLPHPDRNYLDKTSEPTLHDAKSDGSFDAKKEEEAERAAMAKAKERNAKKKEKRKRTAAAKWEKKNRAEQARRELKEKRKKEQEEAAQKAREAREAREAKEAKEA
ncbi:hypothetical protein F5B19DRAFT_504349 [Rostrohypoxylon terebratum]|nr:hypothetical protein F5B19DRAFT_504349 [Rostrohypoxylon terebratum]